MRTSRTPLALVLLAASASAYQTERLTSGRPAPPEQTCYDVLSYDLSVKVDPDARAIEGRLRMLARRLAETDRIELDLDDRLRVSEVSVGQAQIEGWLGLAAFRHEDGVLSIDVSEERVFGRDGRFLVEVVYGGQPRVAPRPPWDGGFQWERTPSGAHWIATSNQMQGADLWWPCKDQPDDEPEEMTISVTVPAGLVCATNGRKVAERTADGWTTTRWRVSTPINAYGVALNIAPYETITREYRSVTGETFPITYWVLPENRARGEELFEDVLRQTRWFEETFGPYPFRADKYGVAETPHLGMEHQTIIAYGANYVGNPWGDDQGFDFLHHHEMAHEWFANLVTCRDWKDFWIHESFATYAQSLYTEHLNGPEAYRHRMAEIRTGLLNRAAVAPRRPMDTAAVYFGAQGGDIYYKGAWVLHTLRFLVGDEAFFRALRRVTYPDPALERTTDGSACRFVDSDEVLALFEEHTGHELDWFFELYLRQPELPTLRATKKGARLYLEWETPGDLAFPLPVEVSLDGELRRVALPDGRTVVEIGNAEVVVDPHAWLLKKER